MGMQIFVKTLTGKTIKVDAEEMLAPSALHLVLRLREGIQIFVKTLTGKTIIVYFCKCSTLFVNGYLSNCTKGCSYRTGKLLVFYSNTYWKAAVQGLRRLCK